MLAWPLYISFAGMAWVLMLKSDDARSARLVAMLASMLGFLCALAGAWQYSANSGLLTVVDLAWVPQLKIRYHLAVDGISVTLVLLTGLAAVAGVLFSWNIEH